MAEQNPRLTAEQGVDLLADGGTKEVLRKLSATMTHPELNIVVVGKTGVGKTTMINGLFETEEAQTIIKPHKTQTIVSHHMRISSPYEAGDADRGRDITVKVTDTPGTEAILGIDNKKYLKVVSGPINESDIVLYCIRMDDEVRTDDVNLIRFMLKNFGNRLWTRLVFVLTFANRVVADYREEDLQQRCYEVEFGRKQQALKTALREVGLAEAEIQDTCKSLCVAGHPENKRLPFVDDWACPFIVNCLKSGITDNTKCALLQATWKRINLSRGVTAVAGVTGVATGIGIIVAGGVLSSTVFTVGIGAPLVCIGAGITIYSAGAGVVQTVRTEIKYNKDMETANGIEKLRPDSN